MARAVRLSSVTFVCPAQTVELFGNVFAPSNTSWTWAVCVQTLSKNSKSSRGSCKLNTREYGLYAGEVEDIGRIAVVSQSLCQKLERLVAVGRRYAKK